MNRLRWWLARRIAPHPIMTDPYPGVEGVFVVMRTENVTAYVRADKFRLKHTTRLPSLDYDSTEPYAYPSNKSSGRFVGTVAG